MSEEKTQADKFKEAARKAEADESEAAWEAKLEKVVKPHRSNRQPARSK